MDTPKTCSEQNLVTQCILRSTGSLRFVLVVLFDCGLALLVADASDLDLDTFALDLGLAFAFA